MSRRALKEAFAAHARSVALADERLALAIADVLDLPEDETAAMSEAKKRRRPEPKPPVVREISEIERARIKKSLSNFGLELPKAKGS